MILSLKFSLLTKWEEEEGEVRGQSSENKKEQQKFGQGALGEAERM